MGSDPLVTSAGSVPLLDRITPMIPVSSDAPLYYRPWGTVGLILANCLTFWWTAAGNDGAGWLLTLGDGWHPAQWMLAAFVHFGLAHLLGNMIFLWAYGMIIEGKIGTGRFLTLYLLMCAIDGALTQTIVSRHQGTAGGASGVLFGLMAIAVLWAPFNSFQILWGTRYAFWTRTYVTDVSVLAFSAVYLCFDLLGAWLARFGPATPTLHLLGALMGLPIGWLFLHRGWVDCEDWDLFSIIQGKRDARVLKQLRERSNAGNLPPRIAPAQRRKKLRHVQALVDRGQHLAAFHEYWGLRAAAGESTLRGLDEPRLKVMIDALRKAELWRETSLLLADFLKRFPDPKGRARLMYASILARELNRPRAALRALEQLDVTLLEPHEQQLAERVQTAAEHLISQGVIEVSEESYGFASGP